MFAFWWSSPQGVPVVSAGPHLASAPNSPTPITGAAGTGAGASLAAASTPTSTDPAAITGPTACIPPYLPPTPTPTASSTPTPTPAIGPTETPTPTPTPTPITSVTPTPTSTPVPLNATCIVSTSPTEAFNALGTPHTVTFFCGNEASTLTGPAANPYPPGVAGCFDVQATVTDVTTGVLASFISASCAGNPVSSAGTGAGSGTVDCTSVANPVCAIGFAPTGPGGLCQPACPSGFVYSPTDRLCHAPPSPECPPGSTPVFNAARVIVDCIAPPLTTPTQANEVTVTINPGAPHVYSVTFTGFVGTTATGSCPPGTELSPSVNLSPTGGTVSVAGPGCRFSVTAFKKYIEGTKLTIIPIGTCGESVSPGLPSQLGGTPCYFEVQATGTVTLKTGVNCTNGSEPATGTSAFPAGFPLGAVYQCTDSTLSVTNVPVPRIAINLSATNGFFVPTCIPQSRAPRVTPTPSVTATTVIGIPLPTATPTRTPTATPTPTATLFPAGAATAVPPSQFTGSFNRAFCGPPGSPTTQVITNEQGIAGAVGQQVEYSAVAEPPFPHQFTNETIVGTFAIDGVGIAGAHMYATIHFQTGDQFCDAGITNSAGAASCTFPIANATLGYTVRVDVSFIYNCSEYTTTTSFTPIGNATPTPTTTPGPANPVLTAPAPNGICVIRQGLGPLAVQAAFASNINTQPSLSTGPVVLGEFTGVTPSPTVTNTPVPTSTPTTPTATPTNTPVPTPTFTPTPTPTPTNTPTPTPTPTNTPTPTPTVIVPLRFTLDAARVAAPKTPGNRVGLDLVRQGQRVALVMYYTIRSIPRRLTRVTTYEIMFGTRTVLRVSFRTTIAPTVGQFARYTIVTIPSSTRFGVYVYRATLTIDGQTQRRSWRFAIVRAVSPVRNANSDTATVKDTADQPPPLLPGSSTLWVEVTHRFDAIAGVQLPQDILHVLLDRRLRDEELIRDLSVAGAARDKPKDFVLPLR